MERVSAFMDGESDDHEVAAQLARSRQDGTVRQAWETYHLIGDALRGDSGVAPGFMARFSVSLEQEPTVLAPQPRTRGRATVRRLALSLAASLGGVALVAWLALSENPLQPGVGLVAVTQPAASPAVVKPANGAVNDYLLAHQQFSPSTAMQGVASYVRTVSGREADMR